MRFLLPALVMSVFLVAPAHAAPIVLDRLEASVNSGLVMLSDVNKFRHTTKLRLQIDPLFKGTSVASAGEKAPLNEIVEFLIDERMILQKFPIADSEVEQRINNIQAENHIDRNSLKSAIAHEGFSFDDYFEMIRVGWSKKSLISNEIQAKVNISDDDVKNFYFNNYTKSSSTPLSYHLKIISVSNNNFKTPQAAKETALRAIKALKSGDTFEEVAQRFSDHPSASSGGDLGTVQEDQVAPAVRDQVKKMEIGKTSDLLGGPSTGGYFILKLIDVNSGDKDRFDKMKEQIREQLYAAEYQHQVSLWLERQRQSSYIHRAGENTLTGVPTSPQNP